MDKSTKVNFEEDKSILNNYINNNEYIKSHLKNKIIYSKLYISHDGYDEFGPESTLYDLYILDEKYNLFIFHSEDWYYHLNNNTEYVLDKECNLFNLNIDKDLHDFIKINKELKDDKIEIILNNNKKY